MMNNRMISKVDSRKELKVAALSTADYIAERAKKTRPGAFEKVLDRVPKRKPLPGDEL